MSLKAGNTHLQLKVSKNTVVEPKPLKGRPL